MGKLRTSIGLAVIGAVAVAGLWWLLRQERVAPDVGGASLVELPTARLPEFATPPGIEGGEAPEVPLVTDAVAHEPPIVLNTAPTIATLRVTVVDERSAPIAGARVCLKDSPRGVITTNAEGAVTLTGTFGIDVDAAARHPDYRFGLLHTTMPARGEPDGEATITLTKELTACVRVEDEGGRPIAGADVGFREMRSDDLRLGLIASPDELARLDWNDTFKGIFQTTRTTGPDGRCCAQGLTAGKVLLTAQADGYVTVSYHPADLGPDGGDLGVVQLAAARTLAGTVVDEGSPVPGALVEALFLGRNIGGYVRQTTDADGQFRFTMVPPPNTKVPIRVSHETRGDFFDEQLRVTDDPVTIVLRPSLDVTLRLRDAATKAPVSGPCTITRLMARTGLLFPLQQPKSMDSDNGEVHVGWVPYYATRLQVEARGYAREVVELAQIQATAGAPVDVDLVRTGTIAIHAIDGSTGLPVVGAKMFVTYKGPSPNGPIDKQFNSRNFVADAPFDPAAGAYILDTSVFTFTAGADESLTVTADGKLSKAVPVSANGVRVCGDVINVTLQPKPN